MFRKTKEKSTIKDKFHMCYFGKIFSNIFRFRKIFLKNYSDIRFLENDILTYPICDEFYVNIFIQ